MFVGRYGTNGAGPRIAVHEFTKADLKKHKVEEIFGLFDKKSNTIQISKKLLDDLKNASPEQKRVLMLQLLITTLHEYVHYGDKNYNGDRYNGEEGEDFEIEVFGMAIRSFKDAETLLKSLTNKEKDADNELKEDTNNESAQERKAQSEGINKMINNFSNLNAGQYVWDKNKKEWVKQ